MRKCDFSKVALHQVLLEVFQFLLQVLKSFLKFSAICVSSVIAV